MAPSTVGCQAPPSMGSPRLEYWSGLPFPSPANLPNSGTKHMSPSLAGRFFTTEPLGKSQYKVENLKCWPCFTVAIYFLNISLLHDFSSFPVVLFTAWLDGYNCLLTGHPVSCLLLLLFSCPVMSDSLQSHGLQHTMPPCPSPSPEMCPSSRPLHQ